MPSRIRHWCNLRTALFCPKAAFFLPEWALLLLRDDEFWCACARDVSAPNVRGVTMGAMHRRVGLNSPLCAWPCESCALWGRQGCAPGSAPRWLLCCVARSPMPWLYVCCACFSCVRQPVAVVGWQMSVWRGCHWQPSSLACLSAPRWCATRRPVWLLTVQWSAFLLWWCVSLPGGCLPGFTGRLRGARGGLLRTALMVPAAGPRRGESAQLAPRCTRSGTGLWAFSWRLL